MRKRCLVYMYVGGNTTEWTVQRLTGQCISLLFCVWEI